MTELDLRYGPPANRLRLRAHRESFRVIATEMEKAWAAGFFEGEGSIRIASCQNNLYRVAVELSQVDPEPVNWLRDRWLGRTYSPSISDRQRPYLRWVALTSEAVRFLTDIRPFVVRSAVLEKLDIAVEFQAQKVANSPENRTEEYRARQHSYFRRMAALNLRGADLRTRPASEHLTLWHPNKTKETA